MSRESNIVTEHAVGLSGMAMNTGERLYPTHDEIAQLAFTFYESRGRQDGNQVEDWLRAERELVHHYE
jgi:Protein of unknown function (DUF2934)